MSLRSAPERTREGGRRRSARDVSPEDRRSCAASKPVEAPCGRRRCDGPAAFAQSMRADSAPEVLRTTAPESLIRGGLCRPRRRAGSRRERDLSRTNKGKRVDIDGYFANGFVSCPGQKANSAFQSNEAGARAWSVWTNVKVAVCMSWIRLRFPLRIHLSSASSVSRMNPCCRLPPSNARPAWARTPCAPGSGAMAFRCRSATPPACAVTRGRWSTAWR